MNFRNEIMTENDFDNIQKSQFKTYFITEENELITDSNYFKKFFVNYLTVSHNLVELKKIHIFYLYLFNNIIIYKNIEKNKKYDLNYFHFLQIGEPELNDEFYNRPISYFDINHKKRSKLNLALVNDIKTYFDV